ncbi:MAG TPA: hypothetical protein VIS48_05975 [Candidatus Kryptonia bacterium]
MLLPVSHNYHYLNTDVSVVKDEKLLALFGEIEGLRKEKLQGFVLHFLTQSLHPFSKNQKRTPFKKSEFSTEEYLRKKVKELKESEVYKLCIDLVYFSQKGHIDDYDGTQVYVVLNKTIPDMKKGRKQRKTS